jgi:hypothetical protein
MSTSRRTDVNLPVTQEVGAAVGAAAFHGLSRLRRG